MAIIFLTQREVVRFINGKEVNIMLSVCVSVMLNVWIFQILKIKSLQES